MTGIAYNPSDFTTGNVTVIITLDKPVWVPDGWTGTTETGTVFRKTYTENILAGSVEFYDILGASKEQGNRTSYDQIEIKKIDRE